MSKRENLIKSDKGGTSTPMSQMRSAQSVEMESLHEQIYPHPYPQSELYKLVEYSTVLGQCVEAYKTNIPGFGLTYRYTVEDIEETRDMISEWEHLEEVIELFNFERSFTELVGDLIEDREKCGNGYLEIIRDGKGLPVEGIRVSPTNMFVAKPIGKHYATYCRKGREFTRPKVFKRYAQRKSNGSSYIWFKEFGDNRFMDYRTGVYTEQHNGDFEANEIIHLKIGQGNYGIPRYIGQLIHMYGARKAEELNYNYFYEGRHIPSAIIVSNGMLTDESYESLKKYANDIKGTENAHKFMILEAESLGNELDEDDKRSNVKIEMKSLSEMLQKDALFLEYDDHSRLKVQSAFRLPDIYVGRTRDFNKATSETAREITEEQVFIPERNALKFLLNNVLLQEYHFHYVEADFKRPEISNSQDKATLIKAYNEVGGITPNDIREEAAKLLGKPLENLEGDIYDNPKWTSVSPQGVPINRPTVPILKDEGKALREIRDMLEEQYHE